MTDGIPTLGGSAARATKIVLAVLTLSVLAVGCSNAKSAKPPLPEKPTSIVPEITQINPSSGGIAGSTSVTINGIGFNKASNVYFGTEAALSFHVVSDTDLVALTPPQRGGTRYVFIVGPGGRNLRTPQFGQFTYRAPVPAITGVAPSSGPIAGGTAVQISGTGFTEVRRVSFGAKPAASFKVVSDSEITAVTPSQGVGAPYVVVAAPGGISPHVTGVGQFTYVAPVPTVTTIAPASGPIAGGTAVTITGTGFTKATRVSFGPAAATQVVVVSDTEITAVAPPQGAGARFIIVAGPGGRSPRTTQFTYVR